MSDRLYIHIVRTPYTIPGSIHATDPVDMASHMKKRYLVEHCLSLRGWAASETVISVSVVAWRQTDDDTAEWYSVVFTDEGTASQ